LTHTEIADGADVLCMTTSSCCGTAPRDISIAVHGSTLAFLYCERCETRQWFRDGKPVTLGAVKEEASAAWNKKARRAPVLATA
jgi:hypothetical protein